MIQPEMPTAKQLRDYINRRGDTVDPAGRRLTTLDVLWSYAKDDSKTHKGMLAEDNKDDDVEFSCPESDHIHLKLKYEHPKGQVPDKNFVLDENEEGEWDLNEKWSQILNNTSQLEFFVRAMRPTDGSTPPELTTETLTETLGALRDLTQTMGPKDSKEDKDEYGLYL